MATICGVNNDGSKSQPGASSAPFPSLSVAEERVSDADVLLTQAPSAQTGDNGDMLSQLGGRLCPNAERKSVAGYNLLKDSRNNGRTKCTVYLD